MESADNLVRQFIGDYYYGSTDGAIVAADTDALLTFLRERGWDVQPLPKLSGDIDGR